MKIFHQTKILFLISAVTVLFMSGSISMAQITVKGKAMNVVQAIAQIEKSSGYSFFYNAEDLNGIELGDIDASGTINEILEKIFSGTGITYRIQGKEVVIQKGNTPVAQNNKTGQLTVSGIVIDSSDKQPVAGAIAACLGGALCVEGVRRHFKDQSELAGMCLPKVSA